MTTTVLPELGFYTLPGQPDSSRDLINEVREGEALIIDLRKVEKPSAMTEKIADSRGLVSLSAIAIIAFDIAIFALVVWAVLGA